MKRKPPQLPLTNNSEPTLEQVMGAMALARMEYLDRCRLRTQAEQVIASLRRMRGGRGQ